MVSSKEIFILDYNIINNNDFTYKSHLLINLQQFYGY